MASLADEFNAIPAPANGLAAEFNALGATAPREKFRPNDAGTGYAVGRALQDDFSGGFGAKITALESALSDAWHDKSKGPHPGIGDRYRSALQEVDALDAATNPNHQAARGLAHVGGIGATLLTGAAAPAIAGALGASKAAPAAALLAEAAPQALGSGAKFLSLLKAAATPAAAYGTANAVGAQRGDWDRAETWKDTAGDALKNTAVNTALGTAIPAAISAAAPVVTSALTKLARARALKASGITLSDLRSLQHRGLIDSGLDENQLGAFILENGLKFGQKEEDVARHFGAMAQAEGERVGDITGKLDQLVRAQRPQDGQSHLPLEMTPARPATEYPAAPDLSTKGVAGKSYTEMMSPGPERTAGYGPPNIQSGGGSYPPSPSAQSAADVLMADPRTARQYFVRPSTLQSRIEGELIAPLRSQPMYASMVGGLEKRAQQYGELGRTPLATTLASGEMGPRYADAISFTEAQAQKRSLDRFLDHTKDQTPEKEVLKQLRGILNNEIENRAGALSKELDPSLHSDFMAAKRNFGMAQTVKEIAEDRALRHTANRYLSPSDHGVGLASFLAASAAHGGPRPADMVLGLGGALGNKLLRERGASAAAVTAKGLADMFSGAGASPGGTVQALSPEASWLARLLHLDDQPMSPAFADNDERQRALAQALSQANHTELP